MMSDHSVPADHSVSADHIVSADHSVPWDHTVSGGHTVVFVDLETTDLDTARCHILQLSAVSGDRQFDRYVWPSGRAIDRGASRVNGLTFRQEGNDAGGRDDERGRSLLLRGRPVDAVPLRHALVDFLGFLRSLLPRGAPSSSSPLLLAAHNAEGFDSVVLSRALRSCLLLKEFQEVVTGGFVDTLLLSVKLYPGLSRYSLEELVGLFGLRRSYRNPHNALEDVKVLQRLFCRMNPDEEEVRRCIFQISDSDQTPV